MPPRNPYVCLSIVLTLGLIAVVGIAGVVVSACRGGESSQALVAIVSACVGSLSSFLVAVPRGSHGHGGDQPPPAAPLPPLPRGNSPRQGSFALTPVPEASRADSPH